MSEYKQSLAEKFWLRMGEKFGKRWIEERGTSPNNEWRALINRYSEYQVNLALDELPKWSHPPTHPEMAAHLRLFAAKQQERTAADYCRDRWRSFILAELAHWGWMRGLWRMGIELSALHEPERSRLFQSARLILDETVDEEIRAGREPPDLSHRVSHRCEKVIASLQLAATNNEGRGFSGE